MREKEGKERASDERGKYTGGRERDEKRERQIDICLYISYLLTKAYFYHCGLREEGLPVWVEGRISVWVEGRLSVWVEGKGTLSLG